MDRELEGSDRWATAAELGDFVYCRRAWYWKRHPDSIPAGVEYRPPTESFARGDAVHARIETRDASTTVASRTPYAVALAVALALGIALAHVIGWL